jgi:Family of unknown function (DUF5343)
MALPTSYLTSFKNLSAILDSIQKAQAPNRFTVKFLEDLGYTSSSDRLVIKMLKILGMLRESGEPTPEYHEYLDPSQSGRVLADGLHNAYADLFQINKNAQDMTAAQVRAKFKTISQGAYSDDVLGKMANTFLAFAKHADFGSTQTSTVTEPLSQNHQGLDTSYAMLELNPDLAHRPSRPTRLVYEINIHLPATRDPAVYDALFSSLSKHLDI